MLALLPKSLLALLFALPILSAQTSSNDPFHEITVHAPKASQDPICCLKPLPPLEPQATEEELLLSFEDWKAKLLAEEKSNAIAANDNESVRTGSGKDPAVPGNGSGGGESNGSSDSANSQAATSVTFSQEQLDGANEQLSPHFRVPLTDRFNYANLDCSARVHKSHRSAKSTSSILSSKKDRYMLSPCSSDGNGENHYVIVELCDDIRIDTVQLANFEFFSGVFKDITVSVAKTYTTEPEGWTNAGMYRAKNVRGVQSFHPPTSLRDFYRYIRIDFHSHYGNEYYCPVSLLRVFGLTHLEEWKWDTWEAESKAKRNGLLAASSEASSSTEEISISSIFVDTSDSIPISSTAEYSSDSHFRHSTDMWTLDETPVPLSVSLTPEVHPTSVNVPDTPENVNTNPHDRITTTPSGRRFPTTTPETPSATAQFSSAEPSQALTDTPSSVTGDATSTLTSRSTSLSSSGSTTHTISLASNALLYSPHASAGGGESIYRTIMNRLTVLELNTTLYTRYVEGQTAGVREVLRRLSEDVGRLEGLGKAQAQMYQRSLLEMERQRRRMELEHGELMSRVNYLSEEVIMEKRLGIAQLCILVAVLVFMALTRGSRGELDHRSAILQKFSRGNSWGQRTLSFSGDWVSRFRSRSPTRKPVDPKPKRPESGHIEFPTHKVTATQTRVQPVAPVHHSNQISLNTTSIRRAANRPRTPQSRTPGRHIAKPSTPTGAHVPPPLVLRPIMSRANSHGQTGSTNSAGLVGLAPKSAKKWARTAHLHQVKPDGRTTPLRVDVDGIPPGVRLALKDGRSTTGGRKSSPLRTFLPTTSSYTGGNEENELDAWVDTDDASSDADLGQDSRHHTGNGQDPFMSTSTLAVGA